PKQTSRSARCACCGRTCRRRARLRGSSRWTAISWPIATNGTTTWTRSHERYAPKPGEEHRMTSATGERDNWRDTILAGLANYIDAGSIVAGAAALALWQEDYGLSGDFIGLIGAFGPNAIGAGVGALIGGRLCDKLGRKTIYQWDMLVYAVGMALLVFAVAPWMIVTGFLIVGLAVGADIPASWSLIAEQAPDDERGKHSGVAQVLWYL